MKSTTPSTSLAESITRAASRQTHLTIRLLVDRGRVDDAYRAYAYFRWVDDTLDDPSANAADRLTFLRRQQSLMEVCYRGEYPAVERPEEGLLTSLIAREPDPGSGLHTYLSDMMAVMAFDTDRRGRLVHACELEEYTDLLASAVTSALTHFIGHDCQTPRDERRCLGVRAAHITHMLRDTFEDLQAGYYNIPQEALEAGGITASDVHAPAYREWVRGRVELARHCFEQGEAWLSEVPHLRCRLACMAYVSRFEGVLDLIEQDHYFLRRSYPERKVTSAFAGAARAVFGARSAAQQRPQTIPAGRKGHLTGS